MNILLSAYSCEPGKGSEPGIGWHWTLEIANRGHNVTVITRENNKGNILKYFAKNNSSPKNIKFIYCGFPKWVEALKKQSNFIYPYYIIWQFKAYKSSFYFKKW